MPICDLIYLIKAMRIQLRDPSLTSHAPPRKVGVTDRSALKQEYCAQRHHVTQLVGVNQILSDALLASHHLGLRVQLLLSRQLDSWRVKEERYTTKAADLQEQVAYLDARVQESVFFSKNQTEKVGKKISSIQDEAERIIEETNRRSARNVAEMKTTLDKEILRREAAETKNADLASAKQRLEAIVDGLKNSTMLLDLAKKEISDTKTLLEKEKEATASLRTTLSEKSEELIATKRELAEVTTMYHDTVARYAGGEKGEQSTQANIPSDEVRTLHRTIEAQETQLMRQEEWVCSSNLSATELDVPEAMARLVVDATAQAETLHTLCTTGDVSEEFTSTHGDILRNTVVSAFSSAWEGLLGFIEGVYSLLSGVPVSLMPPPSDFPLVSQRSSLQKNGSEEDLQMASKRRKKFRPLNEVRSRVLSTAVSTAVKTRDAFSEAFVVLAPFLEKVKRADKVMASNRGVHNDNTVATSIDAPLLQPIPQREAFLSTLKGFHTQIAAKYSTHHDSAPTLSEVFTEEAVYTLAVEVLAQCEQIISDANLQMDPDMLAAKEKVKETGAMTRQRLATLRRLGKKAALEKESEAASASRYGADVDDSSVPVVSQLTTNISKAVGELVEAGRVDRERKEDGAAAEAGGGGVKKPDADIYVAKHLHKILQETSVANNLATATSTVSNVESLLMKFGRYIFWGFFLQNDTVVRGVFMYFFGFKIPTFFCTTTKKQCRKGKTGKLPSLTKH